MRNVVDTPWHRCAGSGDRLDSPGEPDAPRRAEPPPAAPAAAAPQPASTLERGAARLRYEGGRVTLEANAAPVRPLLEKLAAEARFELQLEPGDWPPLTASFADR